MSDLKLKWFFFILISALCLLISSYKGVSQESGRSRKLLEANGADSLIRHECNLGKPDIQKAKIFLNQKGLRDQIKIEGPLKEMNTISRTKTKTIEQLIEDIAQWIPKMYREQYSVNPRCIIILETKINENEKAEVRFAVAMECSPKLRSTKPIRI